MNAKIIKFIEMNNGEKIRMNAKIIKFIEMNKDEETIKNFIITNLLKLTLKEQLIQCHHSMNFDFWHDCREPLYGSVVKIHHSYAKTIVKTLMEYGDDEDILNAVEFCEWNKVEYSMNELPDKRKRTILLYHGLVYTY
jgi:hypothetical protein